MSAAASHGYLRAGSDTAIVSDEPRVHQLLLERLLAKKMHKFEKADELRAQLLSEFGVEVFDKTKFWRVAGGRAHVPLPTGESKPRSKPPPKAATPAAASGPLAEPLPTRKGAKALRKQEQAVASAAAQTPISTGFGHAMLLKMGWSGQGSGLRDGSLAEPFMVRPRDAEKIVKSGKRGIAASTDEHNATSKDPKDEGQASAADDTKSLSKKAKKRMRAALGDGQGGAAGVVAEGGAAAMDEHKKHKSAAPEAEAAAAAPQQQRPQMLRAPPPPLAQHPALDAVRALKTNDQSRTAKEVHALLAERGFTQLSLAVVKKLCSEAAREPMPPAAKDVKKESLPRTSSSEAGASSGTVLTTVATSSRRSAKERLVELKELYDMDLIDEDEFKRKKKSIMDGI